MIDLEHLARQTAGDSELEQELLTLFLTQLDDLDRHLAAAPAQGCDKLDDNLPLVLHRVRGAAVAIGVNDYAAILARTEDTWADRASVLSHLAALRSATAEARLGLTRLLEVRRAPGLAKAGESR